MKDLTISWTMAILLFFYAEETFAQWTTKDSLWLEDALASKKEFNLKPEVLEAIKSGNLINFDTYDADIKLMNAPVLIPFSKDFKQYIQPTKDASERNIDYTSMPPSVFMLYLRLPVNVEYELQSFSLAGIENYTPDRPEPLIITDPLMKGQAGGGVRFMINLNDVINYYVLKKRD